VPILRNAVPKYRLHRATKQAVVTLSGRDHYLGPWKSKASLVEYDRLIAEWLAAGRTVPKSDEPLTVAQLLAAYRQYAEKHYRRSDGTPTKTLQSSIAPIARRLREWYGSTAAADFGPLALSAFMERMIAEGCSRNYVNSAAKRIREIYRWAGSRERLPAECAQRLACVSGLQAGRTEARETEPVKPVDDAHVEATLPHLSSVVAAMVQVQRLTGCRPGEVCAMRWEEIDCSDKLWQYQPTQHKTKHHNKERIILLGPKAQAILSKYRGQDPSLSRSSAATQPWLRSASVAPPAANAAELWQHARKQPRN
jgi:integrase